jgi:hypothetical protein
VQGQAETEAHASPPIHSRDLPAAVQKEIARLARELNRHHGPLFKADPKLKDRASRFLRSRLLP